MMAPEPTGTIRIFYCYAREDKALRNRLEKHLGNLKQQGLIMGWHDYEISAGKEWEREISDYLNIAHIILLLVSPSFMHSEYCYSIEMKRALERHDAGKARVIPVLLRPVDGENAPFSKLQFLPLGGKAITSWRNRDEAFLNVAHGIRKVVQELLQEQSMDEEITHNNSKRKEAILTGFKDLDHLTGGLQRSDLIIVAARPSTGKTAFALSIALNVAIKHAQSVGIFSLEMSKEQLVQRLISMDTGIDQRYLRMGRLEDDEWERVVYTMGTISEANIWIEDTAHLTTTQLRRKAQQLVNDYKVDLLIVDYVDLMQIEVLQKGYENRVQEGSEMSRWLKIIARELDVPVLALVQISHKDANRWSKIPRLSDIPSSFENNADIVMFIHRDDMYNPETERKSIADIIVAKHRHGPLGEISLYFQPRTICFRDLMLTPPKGDSNSES